MANGATPGQAAYLPRANPVRLQRIRTGGWAAIFGQSGPDRTTGTMFNSSARNVIPARQFFVAPVAPAVAYRSGRTVVEEGADVRRQVLAATLARQQARTGAGPGGN